MLEKFLEDIGLSDKEAKVYLALLGVDNYSVLDLAKKTNINRTTVYPILEKLMKDQLVSETKIGKKVHYQAESPEKLETFIEHQKIKLAEQAKILTDIVPQLKSLGRQSGEGPIVKYYDGREGILRLVKEYFGPGDIGGTAYIMYSKDLVDEFFSATETDQLKSGRKQRGVKNKAIYNYSKGEIPSDETSERVRVDSNKFPIKCDLQVYKDRVRINTMGKSLSAIYIKSQDVADTLKTLFELAFENIKKDK